MCSFPNTFVQNLFVFLSSFPFKSIKQSEQILLFLCAISFVFKQLQAMTLHTLLLIPDGRNISMQGVPSLMSVKRRPVFPHQPTAHAAPGKTILLLVQFFAEGESTVISLIKGF